MTEQEKELLIKDLCARLPYEVIIHFNEGIGEDDQVLYGCRKNGKHTQFNDGYFVDEFKLYLRPFSKLTWDDIEVITKITDCDRVGAKMIVYVLQANGTTDFGLPYAKIQQLTDYLLSRHFDVHGLIEKGLALNAPEGMYD